MMNEDKKLNKDSAEALGMTSEFNEDIGWCWIPTTEYTTWFVGHARVMHGGFRVKSENMHFHDSRDWTWLLVDACDSRGVLPDLMEELDSAYDAYSLEDLFRLSPLQITQACLEVLK